MKKLLLFIVLFISAKNIAQTITVKQDSITLYNYVKAQQLQQQNPQILIIDDKEWVDFIKKYTAEKQQYVTAQSFKGKPLEQRFAEDDATAESEIAAAIRQAGKDSVNNLFKNITLYQAERRNSIKYISAELKELFFKSLKDPVLVTSTALMLRNLNIEGSETAIKTELLSGKSANPVALFRALEESDSGDVIDYFFTAILKDEKYTPEILFKDNDLAALIANIYFYNKKIDAATRDKLITYSLALLEKFPINADVLKKSGHGYYDRYSFRYPSGGGWSQINIASFLMYSGDKRVIPVIDSLKANGVPENNPIFKFLFWKFDIDKTDATFSALLKDNDLYNNMVFQLYNKGLLTVDNEDFLVKVLSEIEKPAIRFEYQDGIDLGHMLWSSVLSPVFFDMDKTDFMRILNKAIKTEENKKILINNFNTSRKNNIYARLIGQKKTWSMLPENWHSNTFYSKNNRLPKTLAEKCDALKAEMDAQNYKIFEIGNNYDNFTFDGPMYTRNYLIDIQKNVAELKTLSYFFDVRYDPKNEDPDLGFNSKKYEYNCYIIFNDAVYFINVKEKYVGQKKLILGDLAEKMLIRINSPNRLIPVDFWKKDNAMTYTFGKPETINAILSKYNFNNYLVE